MVKDGVAGSIPAGGSTPKLTSANAGQRRVRAPFCGDSVVSFVSDSSGRG
jgi:hypothetical protein